MFSNAVVQTCREFKWSDIKQWHWMLSKLINLYYPYFSVFIISHKYIEFSEAFVVEIERTWSFHVQSIGTIYMLIDIATEYTRNIILFISFKAKTFYNARIIFCYVTHYHKTYLKARANTFWLSSINRIYVPFSSEKILTKRLITHLIAKNEIWWNRISIG